MVRPMQTVKVYGVQDRRTTAQAKLPWVVRYTIDGRHRSNATGTGEACAAAQYGADVIGGGALLAIGVCGHAEVVSLGPTGELVVPFIGYAHTDAPVDVTVVSQPG